MDRAVPVSPRRTARRDRTARMSASPIPGLEAAGIRAVLRPYVCLLLVEGTGVVPPLTRCAAGIRAERVMRARRFAGPHAHSSKEAAE